ncbi:hypothetical protein GQ457_06G004810 [Hibiscus cannabinus]
MTFDIYIGQLPTEVVRLAEWSKAPDSSSGLRKGAWVQIPLLTPNFCAFGSLTFLVASIFFHINGGSACRNAT